MNVPWLSDAELEDALHRARPSAQARALTRMGVAFQRRPDGTLLVSRAAFAFAQNPPQQEPNEQEIVGPWMPLRREWKNTPLGRWQQREREAEAEFRAADPPLSAAERFSMDAAAAKQARQARAALVRHHAAKRRTTKLNRTPDWADMEAIRAVYARAQAISRETGIPHHVDHAIPLQGKLVSGLHVHNNLQILTGSENSKKHNHFEVEI